MIDRLINAIANNQFEEIKKLLFRRVDLNNPFEDKYPLHYAMNEGTYEKTTNLSPNAVVEITGTYKCWWCETERVFNKGERFGECHSCDTKQAGGWHLVKRSEDTPPMTESKSTIDSKGKPWWSRWKFW